jgi:hypothetical protein
MISILAQSWKHYLFGACVCKLQRVWRWALFTIELDRDYEWFLATFMPGSIHLTGALQFPAPF